MTFGDLDETTITDFFRVNAGEAPNTATDAEMVGADFPHSEDLRHAMDSAMDGDDGKLGGVDQSAATAKLEFGRSSWV